MKTIANTRDINIYRYSNITPFNPRKYLEKKNTHTSIHKKRSGTELLQEKSYLEHQESTVPKIHKPESLLKPVVKAFKSSVHKIAQ